VRSVPRDERPARAHAYWRGEDVDGDGLALMMRVRDPSGEMIESPEFRAAAAAHDRRSAALLQGLSEGVIENFDGHNVPSPYFLSDNQTDLNRNFPYFWAPDSGRKAQALFRYPRWNRGPSSSSQRSTPRSFSGSTCTRSVAYSSGRSATSPTRR
jgi:hypothetical protein